MFLNKLVDIIAGSPQFRIKEVSDKKAPSYYLYNQINLENDLANFPLNIDVNKKISTFDDVNLLEEGDLIFSLISGLSTIVRESHKNFIFTQNFIKLIPKKEIDKNFLVFLLNENKEIKKQLKMGLQGSQVLKYSLKQIKALELPKLPTIEKQKIIGELYFKQMKLDALKKRKNKLEKIFMLEKIREVLKND